MYAMPCTAFDLSFKLFIAKKNVEPKRYKHVNKIDDWYDLCEVLISSNRKKAQSQ